MLKVLIAAALVLHFVESSPEVCARVRCEAPVCPNPIKGKCCDTCLEDCRVILCARPSCPNPVTPPGRCCPVCSTPVPTPSIPIPLPTPRDCSRIACFPPDCPNPKPPSPGECCPFCLETCAVVSCVLPQCSNPIVPPGLCCPVCPSPPLPQDCTTVRCAAPTCPNPIPPGPGECCPRCLENCAAVLCARPNCDNPIAPPGRCCLVCPNSNDVCSLQSDPGPCEAAITRWFFDASTQHCRTFTFGGCRGNANNFRDLTSCLNTCKLRCPPGVPQAACAADPCSITQCPAFTNAICVPDFCGGCNARFFLGNGKEVTDQCSAPSNPCELQLDPGPCRGAFPRWYYNSQTKQCQKFIYGGCLGNQNRFTDLQSCLNQCAGKCPPGSPVVQCFANPCQVTQCPAFPNAVCVSNFCGGCNARFFLEDGKEVTDRCRKISCPNGQIFNSCGKTCSPTCEDQRPRSCLGSCTPGCRCPEGTVFDRRVSKCVDSDDCGECPPGKKPFNCLVNPCTVTTCSNFPKAECLFDNCGGCFARFFVGFREVTDQCLITNNCPIKGQVFQQCRTCPATCDNPGLICTQECRSGCGCPPGQFIDERSNRCVPANQCPRLCSIEGQVYQRCRTCPATCNNFNLPCTRECRPGCGCPPGQVVDEHLNKCVPINECSSKRCPIQGQTFQRCKPCPVTCEDVGGPPIACILVCTPGCGCPPGTVLDEKNKRCVKQENCPPRIDCRAVLCPLAACPNPIPADPDNGRCCATCRPGSQCPIRGQFFQSCGTCSATCSNPNKICGAGCRSGCGCPAGQVIDERKQECVPRAQCPSSNADTCQLPVKRGLCRGRFLRYYFSSRTGRCHAFIYGGCGGNRNNFTSRYSCERRCQKPKRCTRRRCKLRG